MTHRANQSEVDDISSKLKFVAKIQANQRVNVKNCLSLHDKHSWSIRFWRTYKGNEGRQATYEFIKELIDRAYDLLSSLRHSVSDYDLEVYKKIIAELIQAETGLRNLTKTYQKDDEYITTIETLIDSLKIKVRELCDYKNIDYGALTSQLVIDIEDLSETEPESNSENKASEKKTIIRLAPTDGSDSSDSDKDEHCDISENWTDSDTDIDNGVEVEAEVEVEVEEEFEEEFEAEAEDEDEAETKDEEFEVEDEAETKAKAKIHHTVSNNDTKYNHSINHDCKEQLIKHHNITDCKHSAPAIGGYSVSYSTDELPLGLDASVPCIPVRPTTPIPNSQGNRFSHKLPDTPPSNRPKNTTPLNSNKNRIPSIETDEALLEILNKVNLGSRRRNKRRKNVTPPSSAPTKSDYTFDLEAGLLPPRGPIKKKVV